MEIEQIRFETTAFGFSFTLENPSASDVFVIAQMPFQVNLSSVIATNKAGTSVTFQLEKRSANSLNSSGTNILSSSLTSSQTGSSTSSFSVSTISQDDFIVLVNSALSGAVEQLSIKINFTKL